MSKQIIPLWAKQFRFYCTVIIAIAGVAGAVYQGGKAVQQLTNTYDAVSSIKQEQVSQGKQITLMAQDIKELKQTVGTPVVTADNH